MGVHGANSMLNGNVPFPSSAGYQGQWPQSGLPQQQFMNSMPSGMNMNMPMGMGMGMDMNMAGMDPRLVAAHQQAMLIAKQTYQYAVAQQAMRDAADEWERGSSVSGWGGGRSSVAPSTMGMGVPNMPMGMAGMNMGMFAGANGFGGGMSSAGSVMNGGMGMGWGGNGMMFPSGPRSMYAGSTYAGSDVGGGWGSRSAYGGESSNTPRDRSSRVPRQSNAPPMPAMPASGTGKGQTRKDGPRPRTRTAPSNGGNAPAQGQAKSKAVGEVPGLAGAVSPPSSWRG